MISFWELSEQPRGRRWGRGGEHTGSWAVFCLLGVSSSSSSSSLLMSRLWIDELSALLPRLDGVAPRPFPFPFPVPLGALLLRPLPWGLSSGSCIHRTREIYFIFIFLFLFILQGKKMEWIGSELGAWRIPSCPALRPRRSPPIHHSTGSDQTRRPGSGVLQMRRPTRICRNKKKKITII